MPEQSPDRPTVSIISVNYKVADLVPKLVASVPAAVAGLSSEVIIVENGSGLGEADSIRSTCPGVHVVASERNLGFARGNNLGRANARGEYLALVNPDVELGAGSIARLVELLRERSRAGLIGPRIMLPNGETQSTPGRLPGRLDLVRALPFAARGFNLRERASRHATSKHLVRCGTVHGSCMVLTAQAFDRIGGMPLSTFMYGEEYLLGHRLAQAGFEVLYAPEVEVLHQDDASANRKWTSHEKRMRKRRAHIIARAEILKRPEYVMWNLLMATKESAHCLRRAKSALGDSKTHGDFAHLHWAAMFSTPVDPDLRDL
jgi:N-acetylglucosaminyl-diphospho-decaprenol L-rhamnosyltransferase